MANELPQCFLYGFPCLCLWLILSSSPLQSPPTCPCLSCLSPGLFLAVWLCAFMLRPCLSLAFALRSAALSQDFCWALSTNRHGRTHKRATCFAEVWVKTMFALNAGDAHQALTPLPPPLPPLPPLSEDFFLLAPRLGAGVSFSSDVRL